MLSLSETAYIILCPTIMEKQNVTFSDIYSTMGPSGFKGNIHKISQITQKKINGRLKKDHRSHLNRVGKKNGKDYERCFEV